MGLVVFADDSFYGNLDGALQAVNGDCSGSYLPYLDGHLPVLGSNSALHGDWSAGEITDNVPALSGDAHIGNGPYVEGELPSLFEDRVDIDSLSGTSNRLTLEGELPTLAGELIPGGEMAGELPLWELTLTGEVPVVGSLAGDMPVFRGESFAGAEISGAVPGIAGDAEAVIPSIGTISELARLPNLSGGFDAEVPFIGVISGDMPGLASFMGGHQDTVASLTGGLTSLTGSLNALTGANGRVTGALTPLRGSLTRLIIPVGNIEGTLPGVITGNIHDSEEYYYGVLRHVRGQVR
jgi:hypothetical protein